MRDHNRVIYTLPEDGVYADTEAYQAIIDCTGISDERSIFSAFMTALHFPSYFGWNWNALNDCLGDLDWIGNKYIHVVLSDFDCMIRAPKLEKKVGLLLRMMSDACHYLTRDVQAIHSPKVLVFDLDVSEAYVAIVEKLLSDQGIRTRKSISKREVIH